MIGRIEILPVLFEKVVLPGTVQGELASGKAPLLMRHWIARLQAWLEVRDAPLTRVDDASLKGIDAGEKAAIQLAMSLGADLVLMDDRKGVNAALRKGLQVTGTLGVLDLAARRGLINFAQTVSLLRQTTFRVPETAPRVADQKVRAARQEHLIPIAAGFFRLTCCDEASAAAARDTPHTRPSP